MPKDYRIFYHIRQKFYKELDQGYYVYAKSNKDDNDHNIDECVKYITRYTSRPPMAKNRIIKYEDNRYIEVYDPVVQFLNNLILHCPDENFKMMRYYGFYSNKNRLLLENIYAQKEKAYQKHQRKKLTQQKT